MGVYNTELYNNLALCCFYAQQYDMTLTCFERALSLATDDVTLADVWYNIGHVALVRLKQMNDLNQNSEKVLVNHPDRSRIKPINLDDSMHKSLNEGTKARRKISH